MAFSPDFRIVGAQLRAVNAAGAVIRNVLSSETVPSLCPNRGDLTKGVGNGSGNSLALISGGTQVLRLAGVASGVNSYTFSSAVTGLPGRMIAQGPDTDIDTYLASKGAGVVGFHPGNGARAMFIDPAGLNSQNSAGPIIRNVASTSLVPSVIPNRGDLTDGIGGLGFGTLFLIIQGLPVLDLTATVQTMRGTLWRMSNTNGPSLQNEASGLGNPTVVPNVAVQSSGMGGTGGDVSLIRSAVETLRIDASVVADDMRLFLYDVTAGTLKRVSRGAVDSGGTGFRSLNVAN